MPKNNSVTKKDGVVKKLKVPAKLRIGTRKAGKSAIRMTTAALKSVLENSANTRDHVHAKVVLNMRGIVV